MVSGTLFRFFSPISQETSNGTMRSNGLLIDQVELRETMRGLVSLLEQLGISRRQVLGLGVGPFPAIANPQSANPDQVCVVDPIRSWNLPLANGSLPSLPPGYRLCVGRRQFKIQLRSFWLAEHPLAFM